MDEKIAAWLCSFSGCTGGNPTSQIWLCGIEWGLQANEAQKYYNELYNGIREGFVKECDSYFDWSDCIKYQYGIKFAKLYQAIVGKPISSYREVTDLKGNEVFAMNLYPIAFNSTDDSLWNKNNLHLVTGFLTKTIYREWCFFNRSVFYKELCRKHRPKIIICNGLGYLRDFLMYFCNADSIQSLNSEFVTDCFGNERPMYWINMDGMYFFVVPFFGGRFGLSSDSIIECFGKRISEISK